jgi:hypothetical protein
MQTYLPKPQKKYKCSLTPKKKDILLESETHFKEQDYVNVPNYITHATKHCDGTAHACSDIILRKVIKYHELVIYEFCNIQETNVSIEDGDGNLTIPGIYCPSTHIL